MGIFAKGSQFPAVVEVDSPQNRYGDQFTKDSAAGDALGEVIGEVNAKAESSNTTTGELIADIEALEGRVTTLEGRVTTLEGQLASAISRIESLENNAT